MTEQLTRLSGQSLVQIITILDALPFYVLLVDEDHVLICPPLSRPCPSLGSHRSIAPPQEPWCNVEVMRHDLRGEPVELLTLTEIL